MRKHWKHVSQIDNISGIQSDIIPVRILWIYESVNILNTVIQTSDQQQAWKMRISDENKKLISAC